MKKRILYIFISLLCCYRAQANNPQLNPYFVKFNQDVDYELFEGENLQEWSSSESLNNALTVLQVTKVEKAFKLEHPDLQGIYVIHTMEEYSGVFKALDAIPGVEYVEQVPEYSLFYSPNDLNSKQWNLTTIKAAGAWDINRNASKVVVAIVDDAVEINHPDLKPGIWVNPGETINGVDDDGNGYIDDVNGYDVADNDNNPSPPASATASHFSHGTHCAGIAAATTDNNTGIASIGFNARIMAVKTKPSATSGSGLPFAYQGVEYAIAAGADIISMSWGGGSKSATYQLLFNVAHSKGIVLVAAAGNSNTSVPMYPASYNHVISVAASDKGDTKASFSNYGSTIDVTAPGAQIWSTVAGSGYDYKSGTSMACPLVSGLCALMVANSPGILPDSVESCLKKSAVDIDGVNPSYKGSLGAGRIDAEAALDCSKGIVSGSFSVNKETICPGQQVQFSATSTGVTGLVYNWSFPGGTPSSSNQVNPKVTYASAGTYDVRLKVQLGSKSDEVVKKKAITVRNPTATMSGTYFTEQGTSAFIKVEFNGRPPFSFTYNDGKNDKTISGVTGTTYYLGVSPDDTTTYSLKSFMDADCNGLFAGSAVVNVIPKDSTCNEEFFSVAHTFSGKLTGGVNIIDNDGNIYVLGGVEHTSGGKRYAYLFKFSGVGKLLWARELPDIRMFSNAVFNHDTTAIVLKGTNWSEDALVAKISLSGNLIWSKTYSVSRERYYYSIVPSDNQSFIFGGMGTGTSGDDLYLVKIKGSDGSIIWERVYNKADDQMQEVCSNEKNGVFASGNDGRGKAMITEVDKDGKLVQVLKGVNVANCLNMKVVDGYAYSMGQVGGPRTTLYINKWNLSDPSSPSMVWSRELSATAPLWRHHMDFNPYTKNIYVQLEDYNDRKARIVAISGDGELVEGSKADFTGRFYAGFNKRKMVLVGLDYNTGTNTTDMLLIGRKDTVGLDYCFLESFSTSIKKVTQSVTKASIGQANTKFSVKATGNQIKSMEAERKCLCYEPQLQASNTKICPGDSVQLHATGGAKYQWAPAPGLRESDAYNNEPWVKPTTTTTYTLIIYNCGCGPDTFTTTVVVDDQDLDKLDLGNDTTLCKGDTLALSVYPGFSSISWSPDYRMTSVSTHARRVFPDVDTSYMVSVKNTFGCALSDTIHISVKDCCSDEASFDLKDPLLCVGEKLKITNTSVVRVGKTYEWKFPGAQNPTDFKGYDPPEIEYKAPGNYQVELIVSGPCGKDTAIGFAAVISLDIDAGPDTSGCAGDTVQIGKTPVSDYTYVWSPPTNLLNPSLSNPKVIVDTSRTYILTVTDDVSGCSATDTVKVTLEERNPVTLNDTSICSGETLVLTLSVGGYGYEVEWYDGVKGTVHSSTTDSLIWVKVSNQTCTFYDTMYVSFDSVPQLWSSPDTTYCVGEYVVLEAIADGATLVWSPDGQTGQTIRVNQPGIYRVTAANDCGDTTGKTEVTEKDCNCLEFVPNIFTPNKDRLNETFGPVVTCTLKDYSFAVYNRWGEQIFYTTERDQSWDGTYMGKEVATGAYFWILRYTGVEKSYPEKNVLSGTVTVLR